MNFFVQAFNTIKTSFNRFASLYILALLSVISFVIYDHYQGIFNYSSTPDAVAGRYFLAAGLAFVMAALFSVLLQLFWEKHNFSFKLNDLVRTAVPFVLCIPLFFVLYNFISCEWFCPYYYCTLGAIVLFCFYFIAETNRENAGLNLITAVWAGEILFVVVGIAFSIVYGAVVALIFGMYDPCGGSVWVLIWAFALLFVGICSAVVIATREDKNVIIPKFFKVYFVYINLPVYALLLLVLYLFLVKAAILQEYPSGDVQIYVSMASAMFLELYVILQYFDGSVVRFFKRFGGLFMVPILIVQFIGMTIRIASYSFTTERFLSIVYIVFSIIAVSVILFKEFKAKDTKNNKVLFALAGVFLLIAGNATVVSDYFMKKNILEICGRYKVLPGAENISEINFTDEERKEICSSWSELSDEEKDSLKSGMTFENLFGFEFKYNWENVREEIPGFDISLESPKKSIDVKGYSRIVPFSYYHYFNKDEKADDFRININLDEGLVLDITETVENLRGLPLKIYDAPLTFDVEKGRYRFYITYGDYSSTRISLDGYVLIK